MPKACPGAEAMDGPSQSEVVGRVTLVRAVGAKFTRFGELPRAIRFLRPWTVPGIRR